MLSLQLNTPNGPPHLILERVNNQYVLTTNTYVYTNNTLPNFTDYFSSLTLNWKISPDNGLTWIYPWANKSSNQTFVTLANPVGGGGMGRPQLPVYKLTDFYAGIWGAIGAINQNDMVTKVFSGFQNRTITRADGGAMTYYGQWNTNAHTTTDLIQGMPIPGMPGQFTGPDGRCTAWSRFFIDVLRADGGDFSYAANYKVINVRPQFRQGAVWGFLVKNWTFQNAGAIPAVMAWNGPRRLGYTNANQVAALDLTQVMVQVQDPAFPNDPTRRIWQYSWVGGNANAGFTDQAGIPGQNTTNPQSMFPDHVVVKIGNTLFDPSYGATYDWAANNELGDFQTKAVGGIVGLFTLPGTQRRYIVALAPAANQMNQFFRLS